MSTPACRAVRQPPGARRRPDAADPVVPRAPARARSRRARSRRSSASPARASTTCSRRSRQHGFVVHLPGERRWGLGTAAFELAGGYARQQPLARLGRPLIAALADRTGESAHLAVMTGRDVLYIVEERAPRRPALVTDVGVRLPAHLTATGRAMLAALPREQVRALYPDAASFADRTGRGPARPGELRELLRGVRADGFATEDGEVTLGLRSVGVAVARSRRLADRGDRGDLSRRCSQRRRAARCGDRPDRGRAGSPHRRCRALSAVHRRGVVGATRRSGRASGRRSLPAQHPTPAARGRIRTGAYRPLRSC